MNYSKKFKIALIDKGITKRAFAERFGVSSTYVNNVVLKMDKGTSHLLPRSETSKRIQEAVKDIVHESKELTPNL